MECSHIFELATLLTAWSSSIMSSISSSTASPSSGSGSCNEEEISSSSSSTATFALSFLLLFEATALGGGGGERLCDFSEGTGDERAEVAGVDWGAVADMVGNRAT